MGDLVQHLIFDSCRRTPAAEALRFQRDSLTYAQLAERVRRISDAYLALGLNRQERVAVYLDKRFETVVSMFGAADAGGVFVPINPMLKPEQVGYILRDCNVRILVTGRERYEALAETLTDCPDLRDVIIVGPDVADLPSTGRTVSSWEHAMAMDAAGFPHRVIDRDMAAILYTSGSTGRPKGVVLSHRNIVAGATSVASYLENRAEDRILSVLPLSFDAGFSQLTTAFHAGACAVLMNYLLPRDVISVTRRERITGITAVPPLWIQLAQHDWADTDAHLRYIATTGGRMPRATVDALRARLPRTQVFLMYGLTEAFRSTFLPPAELDRRPGSIGKAIPNAEILVVGEGGRLCKPGEPGELVHRGALVSLGYWNDPEKTAERFRPAPGQIEGIPITELAVWSGDTVTMDDEGFLYFVGRRDEMIKTSGYRVSPTEVEEAAYATGQVGEVAAFGIPHAVLGEVIALAVTPPAGGALDTDALLEALRPRLPAYMIPAEILPQTGSLPRNPNGKIDRRQLAERFRELTVAAPS